MRSTRPTGESLGAHPVPDRSHRPFGLVLSGGGARGLAHAGVLRGLEAMGCRPAVIVGVSMGAIVAVAYGSNDDWYRHILSLDPNRLPRAPVLGGHGFVGRARALLEWRRLLRDVLFGWGIETRSAGVSRRILNALTRGRRLEEARIPLIVVATDLLTGERVALSAGPADTAAYASAALAGLLPPMQIDDRLLVDGAYADPAPIDLARREGVEIVIAVEPEQDRDPAHLRNGLQAMLRAMEICSLEHTRARLSSADLVLKPEFHETVDLLDFTRARNCVAAGVRVVRRERRELCRLLWPDQEAH